MRMSFYSALRQGSLGISIIGMLAFVAGCGSQDPGTVGTDPSLSSPLPSVAIAPGVNGSEQAPFTDSMVPSTAKPLPPPVPVPQLIPPTSSNAQVTTTSAGRSDPFAPLPPSDIVVTARPTSANLTVSPPAPLLPAVPTAPLPTVSVSALPAPTLIPSANTPAQPLPVQKPLAETIEISGFVEVGGSSSLIVSVPGEPTSRPAKVGEYLGNGNVLIKRVTPQPSGDVLVILEQDGVEYQRRVGSNPASLLGSL